MNYRPVLRSLKAAHQTGIARVNQIEQAISVISSLDGSTTTNGYAPRKRRRMSAAGRRRIAAAQRARWARVRAKQ